MIPWSIITIDGTKWDVVETGKTDDGKETMRLVRRAPVSIGEATAEELANELADRAIRRGRS